MNAAWEVFSTALNIVIYLYLMKALFLGSDFSISEWMKHGDLYTKWYDNREKFDPSRLGIK